MKLSFIDYNQY